MARKVNTKFVIALSVALCSVSGVLLGIKARSYFHNRDPEVFKAQAAEAEKAGNKLEAANNYSRAAVLMAGRHESGADELFSRSAELYMDVSKNAQTQEDALIAYNSGKEARKQALLENPRNKQVNAAALEDDYLDAQAFPSLVSWAEVESTASNLIKTSDSIKPRLYRGQARLQKLKYNLSGGKTAGPDAFTGVDEDVAAALKMDPNSGRAVALAAAVMQAKAIQGALGRGLRTNVEFQNDNVKEDSYVKQMQAAETYLGDYLKKNEGQPDAAFQLAQLLRLRYDLSGRLDAKGNSDTQTLDQIIVYAEQAVANSTDNIIDNGMADFVVENYLLAKKPEKAEAVYRDIIARASDQPIGYFYLAQLFVRLGDLPKAIESYKDVTRHPKIGIERDAVRNTVCQWKSLEMVAWFNMDLVDQNATPTANPDRMKEAADYTDKLRTSHSPRGIVDLLDGRAQLINRAFPQADASLRRAEANLANNRPLQEDYRRTEMTLSQLNQMQGQLGGALQSLDKALAINGDDLEIILKKGGILVQLGRYEEARFLLEHYLGAFDDKKQEFANQDRLPQAFVDPARHIWSLAFQGAGKILPDTIAHDSAYYLQTALAALNAEDYDSAADNADHVLEKQDTNIPAYNQKAYETGIIAHIQLKQKDEAKALAVRALQKFPDNSTFQVLNASLDLPGLAVTPADQRKLVGHISDEFTKQMSLASISRQEKDWDGEIAALQKAEDVVKAASTPDERDRLAAAIDRIFSACMAAASATKGTPKQESYYALAQTYVTKAEKLNQDGTSGLLYRGRLEFVKTDGKSGIDFLHQAVSAHPDYAVAHFILGEAYLTVAMMNTQSGGTSGENAAKVAANNDSALDEFRQVLRLAPNNLAAVQFATQLLIQNGDTTSLKEAQQLVENGLRLAPHSPFFLRYSEFLSGNLKEAITRRLDIIKQNKDDTSTQAVQNRLFLAGLYMRQKDELGTPPAVKASDIASAIDLVNWAHLNDKTNLKLADLLAHYLVEDDHSDAGATKALNVYSEYLTTDQLTVRFSALLFKGEFLHHLNVTPEAFKALRDNKLVQAADPKSEADLVLQEALKIQPADSSEAERHLGDLYFEMGSVDMGRMRDAQKIYAKVLEKEKEPPPRDPVLHRFIEAELRLEPIPEIESDRVDFNDAIKRLDEIIKKDPHDIDALLLRAFACFRQKGIEKDPLKQKQLIAAWLEYVNRVLAIDPSNPDALYYRALAIVQSGGEHLDDAIRDLALSVKPDPKRPDHSTVKSQMLLADIYRHSQRYEEASIEYAEVLDAHPDLLPARIDYADFLMSMTQQLRTFPTESSEDFVISIRRLDPEGKLYDLVKKSSEIYPNQPKWVFMYAQLLSMQDKDAQALKVFEALYLAVPGEASIIDAYLDSLCRNKNYAKAVDVASPVIQANADYIEKNPEWTVLYLRRAAAYRSLGKQKEALDDVEHALSVAAGGVKDQNYAPFISVLGRAVEILSNNDDEQRPAAEQLIADRLRNHLAANAAETSTKVAPETPTKVALTKVGLMQMLLLLKQPDEALKIAQSTTLPDNDPALKILLLRQLAMVNYEARQYAESDKDFTTLFALVPKDVESLNNYAFMLTDSMNQAAKGVEMANKALQVLNTEAYESQVTAAYANIYDTLGWAKLNAGDTDGAIKALQHSVQTQPSSDAYYHLARAYQKAGQIPAAQQRCFEGIQLATKRKDAVLADLMSLQVKLK